MTIPQIRKSVLSGTDFWEKGLSFDVIATRDIFPGEEVFIDYGIGKIDLDSTSIMHILATSDLLTSYIFFNIILLFFHVFFTKLFLRLGSGMGKAC